ncbi:hypothetical protein BH18THE2_BH18THE2_12050 [soil metagenome]
MLNTSLDYVFKYSAKVSRIVTEENGRYMLNIEKIRICRYHLYISSSLRANDYFTA